MRWAVQGEWGKIAIRRLSDKKAWDQIIYGLIYPGFLGSMIYEFAPTEGFSFSPASILTLPNIIRVAILTFYFLDYIHLYFDMDKVIRDKNKKSFVYFFCDILTCCGYLVAFLTIPNYASTLIVFGFVPVLFLWYKYENCADRKFFIFYIGATAPILLCKVALQGTHSLSSGQYSALALIIVNLLFYLTYIFWYYERYSRRIDIKLYRRGIKGIELNRFSPACRRSLTFLDRH